MKYIFKQVDTYTPSETTVEFTADALSTILEQFEMFLRGSGFQFNGNLDFVSYDEFQEEEVEEEHEWVQEKRADEEWPFAKIWADKKESIYEDGYESPSSAAFQHTVNSLMNPPKFRANEELKTPNNSYCPVCSINRIEMRGHKCWDKKCPLPESAVNANEG